MFKVNNTNTKYKQVIWRRSGGSIVNFEQVIFSWVSLLIWYFDGI